MRIAILLMAALAADAVELHPGAFRLVLCWVSDTAQPVAAELNVTAIRSDRNQYDYTKIWEKEGWFGVDEVDCGYLKYRIISDNADLVEYLVADGGGGSMTMVNKVVCKRGKRKLIVDGKESEIVVLTVQEVSAAKK